MHVPSSSPGSTIELRAQLQALTLTQHARPSQGEMEDVLPTPLTSEVCRAEGDGGHGPERGADTVRGRLRAPHLRPSVLQARSASSPEVLSHTAAAAPTNKAAVSSVRPRTRQYCSGVGRGRFRCHARWHHHRWRIEQRYQGRGADRGLAADGDGRKRVDFMTA